ncbi:MAG: hypothetical protein JO040_12920 [Gemmatimonadetes bacterium]|nr:hypothetical protein [Gemmatimonadota bacterium]
MSRNGVRRIAALGGFLLALGAVPGHAGAQRPPVRHAVPVRAAVPDVADLPLDEVPATGSRRSDVMAVLLTGDGGWAHIDRVIGERLAQAGIPTVGWNSMRYYWTERTPEGASRDLARIMARYGTVWNRDRVVLIGYSFGADVLPFLVNRLPPEMQARVVGISLLGFSDNAVFKFRPGGWFGFDAGTRYPTIPEIARITRIPVSCVYGTQERDTLCPSLHGRNVTEAPFPGAHHFDGDYDALAAVILRTASAVPARS